MEDISMRKRFATDAGYIVYCDNHTISITTPKKLFIFGAKTHSIPTSSIKKCLIEICEGILYISFIDKNDEIWQKIEIDQRNLKIANKIKNYLNGDDIAKDVVLSALNFRIVSWDEHLDNIAKWQEKNSINQWNNAVYKYKPVYQYAWKDNVAVKLIPEPTNKYDTKAIKVYIDKLFVGFIPREINEKYYLKLLKSKDVEASVHGGNSRYLDEKNRLVTVENTPIVELFVSDILVPVPEKRQWQKPFNNYRKGRKLVDDYIVIDLETTGLSPNNDEIVEIGAIKFENDIEVSRFHEYIKPIKSIPEKATLIHGITDEMVKDCPSIQEVLPKLKKYIGDGVLVAHNASFDMSFIQTYNQRYFGETFQNIVLDTLKLSRKYIPTKNHKLETLKNYFEIDALSHTAIDDCFVASKVYLYCKKEAQG